nr:MAG TPA: Effector protein NleG [Caudoviricetes sp.]
MPVSKWSLAAVLRALHVSQNLTCPITLST